MSEQETQYLQKESSYLQSGPVSKKQWLNQYPSYMQSQAKTKIQQMVSILDWACNMHCLSLHMYFTFMSLKAQPYKSLAVTELPHRQLQSCNYLGLSKAPSYLLQLLPSYKSSMLLSILTKSNNMTTSQQAFFTFALCKNAWQLPLYKAIVQTHRHPLFEK